MTRRLTITILGVVFGAIVLAGFGTAVLAFRSGRVQTREEVTSLTRNLLEVARVSRAPVVGVVENCDAITRPGRKRLCERRAAAAAATTDRITATRTEIQQSFRLDGIAYALVNSQGEALDDQGRPGATLELPSGVSPNDIDVPRLVNGEQVSGVRRNVAFSAGGAEMASRPGVTVIIVATRRLEPFFGRTFRWFATSALVALLGAAVAAWQLGRRLARPIQAATATTTQIASGDLAARLPESGETGELAELSHSINAMADSLQRSRGLEQQFLMSVSHDLRTPLTNIRGYAEAIADGASPDPADSAGVILRESRRLERLVADLLDLAKLDSNEFRFHRVIDDAAEIVSVTAIGFRPEAANAGLDVDVTTDGPAWADVDADRLSQVVANLVDNAIKFAHHRIGVSAGPANGEGRRVRITVSDDGPGISPDDLPHVFERLYTAAHAPQRKESGSGLGLAIAWQLVTGMGGTLSVASTVGAGTTFTIEFPAVDPPGPSEVPQ